MTEVPGYAEFEFDLPEALLQRLIVALDAVPPVALTEAAMVDVPDVQGVYELSLLTDGALKRVYLGKTDSEAGLKRRLRKHARKIQYRIGLEPGEVYFKALRVFVFTAVDLETQLIKHYGGVKAVDWQGSGFGANDPGRERDTTRYKDDHFDARFPIDIDRPFEFDVPHGEMAAAVFRRLKKSVPYLIRFERVSKGAQLAHADLESTAVSLQAADRTSPAAVISAVVSQLPAGWHATMLPSHVIIYKNDDRKFPSGRLLAKS